MVMRWSVASAIVMVALAAVAQAGGVTTTTTVTTTSTTTTLQPACTDEATFASIECRLLEQEMRVTTESDLGPLQPKLERALAKASQLVGRADGQCDDGNARGAGKSLKKAIRRLIQYNHRLGSLSARKKVPAELRGELRDAGGAIQRSAKTLKKSLVCPPASPGGAFVS